MTNRIGNRTPPLIPLEAKIELAISAAVIENDRQHVESEKRRSQEAQLAHRRKFSDFASNFQSKFGTDVYDLWSLCNPDTDDTPMGVMQLRGLTIHLTERGSYWYLRRITPTRSAEVNLGYRKSSDARWNGRTLLLRLDEMGDVVDELVPGDTDAITE